MKFTDVLKNGFETNKVVETKINESSKFDLNEKNETPEELLRKSKYKIKLVTPTAFGTQIEFSKMYNKDEIEELLSDFNLKFKGNSVFVVD